MCDLVVSSLYRELQRKDDLFAECTEIQRIDTKKCVRFSVSGSKLVWVLLSSYFLRLLNTLSEHESEEKHLHTIN